MGSKGANSLRRLETRMLVFESQVQSARSKGANSLRRLETHVHEFFQSIWSDEFERG